MSNEIWKDIEGYEGLYQVSNMGRVRSLDREQHNHTKMQAVKGRILKIHYNPQRKNYASVTLCKDGEVVRHYVHRIVAAQFIPITDGLNMPDVQVDHINGNPKDNRATNLRWCTAKENNGFELHRRNVSNAMAGKFSGERAYWFGKHHTNESIKKMSESHQGIPSGMKGRHHTEQARAKMSASRLGAGNHKSMQIQQISLTGAIIAIFGSIREMERSTGYSRKVVANCCNGAVDTAYGYKWSRV